MPEVGMVLKIGIGILYKIFNWQRVGQKFNCAGITNTFANTITTMKMGTIISAFF
jgi:hypothetical protein